MQDKINTFEGNANTLAGNAGVPRTPSRCDAKKIALAGRQAARLLACESKGTRKGISTFPCIGAAQRSYSRTAANVIRRGVDCSESGPDELDYEAVYPFVTAVVDHLASPSGAFLD